MSPVDKSPLVNLPEAEQRGKVRAAFDRAAESYDAAATLQRMVADNLMQRLPQALALLSETPDRILDAGCGTGYGGGLLRQALPQSQLIELDLAPAMLLATRRKRPDSLGICADLAALPLAQGCLDFVWSSLALQWLGDGREAFAQLAASLKSGGVLQFASLGPATLWELNHAFSTVDGYRHVNRFAGITELQASLQAAGFDQIQLEVETLVMPYDDMAGVVRDLKAIGARRVLENGVPGLMGKARWQQAAARYDSLRQNGQLPASYEAIYGLARKK